MKQDPADIILTASNVGHTASRGMDGWEMELKVEFLKLLINFFPISVQCWVLGYPQSHIPRQDNFLYLRDLSFLGH